MPPVMRGRSAEAEAVQEEEEKCADAIDISSDSDAASEEDDASTEDDDASTEDDDYIDTSDDDDDDESAEESEEEAEVLESGVDRSDAARNKIADLLRRGRNLVGFRLGECKAYLRKNGLSQTGSIATCRERIMLHWRLKDGDPEKIYPRSSFCINCKGDVCRGDAVLFKQKVYEKRGKKRGQCLGKRIVAGEVVKESYGKEKQQHTFTIQVFWSKGASKLPPLHRLLIKGRNLYRLMTLRQPWANEAERLTVLEEKHMRGNAARSVRDLNKSSSAGNVVLKSNKSRKSGKHQSQFGKFDAGAKITKGKKCSMESSSRDMPTKRPRKGESRGSFGQQFTGHVNVQRIDDAKANHATLDKTSCIRSSRFQYNGCAKTNHVASDKNCHRAPFHNGSSSRKDGKRKRKADSRQKMTLGGSHAQFEGRNMSSTPHIQVNHGNVNQIGQPFFEKIQRPPPPVEVGNILQPHINRRPIACANPPGILFDGAVCRQHPNAPPAVRFPPDYVTGASPNPFGVLSAAFDMPASVHHYHQKQHLTPHFSFPRRPHGFPR